MIAATSVSVRAMPLRSSAKVSRAASFASVRASATSSSKTTPMNDGVKKQGKDIADAAAEKVEVLLKDLKSAWDATDEKPAVVAIVTAAFVALWGTSGLLDAVNKLPLMGGFLEMVGLIFSSWFAYRYLIFGPNREELTEKVRGFYKEMTGQELKGSSSSSSSSSFSTSSYRKTDY